jgi:hypothetical protein
MNGRGFEHFLVRGGHGGEVESLSKEWIAGEEKGRRWWWLE